MRSSRAALLLCVVGGCREEVAVGVLSVDERAQRADAALDGTADVPSEATPGSPDAARDAARPPPPPPPSDAPELTGIGSRAVSLSGDRFVDARAQRRFRIAYTDDAGRVRVEQRTADTLERTCWVSLGAPSGVTVVSPPMMPAPSESVYVAAREGGPDGPIAFWYRLADATEGACGPEMLPWQRLPAPAGESWATAPGVATIKGPGGETRTWVAGTARSGAVFVAQGVHTGVFVAFEPWLRAPAPPEGTRVVSLPTPGDTGIGAGRVLVVLESSDGARQVAFRVLNISAGRWSPAWDLRGVGGGRPEGALGFRVSFADVPRSGALTNVLFARIAYADGGGHVWAQSWDSVVLYGDWLDLGAPFAGAPAAAVALGTAYSAATARAPVVAVTVPAAGPRTLAWSTIEDDVWSSQRGGWRVASDLLP